MARTKIKDRNLPSYTQGEEAMNMITHIIGGGMAVVVLFACIIYSAWNRRVDSLVCSFVYGFTMITLYTMSSTYHGIKHEYTKKVLQVLDHCAVYLLIAGSYTPILICSIRKVSPLACWVVFGIVWGLTILAIILNAIDLKKFRVFSMICYIGIGWCVIFAAKIVYRALTPGGFWLLIGGGILYSVGAILYGAGRTKRYAHSVFHIFVLLGSLAHFFCIIMYVL